MVVCGVSSEAKLLKAHQKAKNRGIDCALFFEPDIDEYTAFASEPISGSARKVFSRYPLWKGE